MRVNGIDEEKIGKEDRVLVAIPNQYMLFQTKWYHSMYPEGIWEAVIIPFTVGNTGKRIVNIMYNECLKCGFFSNVYVVENGRMDLPVLEKIKIVVNYFFLNLFRKRDLYDKKLIESITGKTDYKKIIVHSRCNSIENTFINIGIGTKKILICMEEGLSDYAPLFHIRNVVNWEQILYFILAKLNIMNFVSHGYQYRMKCDSSIIKYSSLPDKLKYRNYKKIKQLFADETERKQKPEAGIREAEKKYDLIIFSAPFVENYHADYIYEFLHKWLKKEYADKAILIKPHPREEYPYQWDDLNVKADYMSISGEEVLDLFPETPLLFLSVSTLLLKACRENRQFKVVYFKNIQSKSYHSVLNWTSKIMELQEENWIVIDT